MTPNVKRVVNSDKVFVCRYCKQEFTTFVNKLKHEANIHTPNTQHELQCQFCPRTFKYRQCYDKHVLLYHRRPAATCPTTQVPSVEIEQKQAYSCKNCPRTFKNHHSWVNHTRTHLNDIYKYDCWDSDSSWEVLPEGLLCSEPSEGLKNQTNEHLDESSMSPVIGKRRKPNEKALAPRLETTTQDASIHGGGPSMELDPKHDLDLLAHCINSKPVVVLSDRLNRLLRSHEKNQL